jgi:thiol:disulfide interchange protein
MKLLLLRVALAVLFGAVVSVSPAFSQRPSHQNGAGMLEPVAVKTDLYPADADAKKEIGEALKLAATDHKRVLLVFGANWCYDCHVLDRALHEGAAGKIVKESFLLVHVDIGESDKNPDVVKRYKINLDKGVPVVAILESDGRLLYGSHDGEFEAARKMMKTDLVAFLNRWKESPLPKPGADRGSPRGQPAWGGGCDRVLGST